MTERKRTLYVCLALIGAVLAIYNYLWQCDFIDFDDNSHVYENPAVRGGFGWSGIVWAFTHVHGGQWIPLTWLSHMLDVSVFALEPGPHHLVSVLIHACSAVLLFWTLQALRVGFWESATVAALFAVHPLNVESVAWVAERKNVLSTLFWILAMLAYARYVKGPSVASMALVTCAMALGLMTKGMLVTLPCALLLLDAWPLDRWRTAGWKRVILEKLPLFALTIAFSLITTRAAAVDGALVNEERVSLGLRLLYIPANYLLYLGKLLVPLNLSILYPNPVDPPVLRAVLGILVLAVTTLAALRVRKVAPFLLVGWLWFLGTLFPLSGIIPLGKTIFAERFTYVPQIGLFLGVVCGVAALARAGHATAGIIRTVTAIVLAVYAGIAFLYVQYWTDTESIFSHAVESHDNNYSAHGTLGWALSRQGKLSEAAGHYKRALEINPGHAEARANLGVVLSRAGNTEGAIQQFRRALEIDPHDYSARFNLATHLVMLDKPQEAIPIFHGLAADERVDPRVFFWLGKSLAAAGRNREAVEQFQVALKHFPADKEIQQALADAQRTLR